MLFFRHALSQMKPQRRLRLSEVSMIGIIGATGNVGTTLVRTLADAGENVVAISRRGSQDTLPIRHAIADLARPEQLRDALRGTEAVFLMIAGSGEGLDARAIVDALSESVEQRIVLLSS